MRAALLIVGEKIGWTFAYTFVAVIVGSGGSLFVVQAWLPALDTAGFAAIICLITSGVTLATGLALRGLAETFLRVGLTFVQAFLGAITASHVAPSVLHAPWQGALGVAVVATLPSLLKVLLAQANRATIGGSVIPRKVVAR